MIKSRRDNNRGPTFGKKEDTNIPSFFRPTQYVRKKGVNKKGYTPFIYGIYSKRGVNNNIPSTYVHVELWTR